MGVGVKIINFFLVKVQERVGPVGPWLCILYFSLPFRKRGREGDRSHLCLFIYFVLTYLPFLLISVCLSVCYVIEVYGWISRYIRDR